MFLKENIPPSHALSFYRSQNVLCHSKKFCAGTKTEFTKANHLLVWDKKFWPGAICNQFLVWHKNFGPAQNVLGLVKGQDIIGLNLEILATVLRREMRI